MKPGWEYAPAWAQWLAKDLDGTWCWFAKVPFRGDECWHVEGLTPCMRAAENDWKDTLEERPRGEGNG